MSKYSYVPYRFSSRVSNDGSDVDDNRSGLGFIFSRVAQWTADEKAETGGLARRC